MSQPADPTQLRDRLAEVLREAPVRGTVMRMTVLTELYGPVDALTDAVLAVVQPLLDAKDTEIDRLNTDLAAYDYYDGPPPRAIDSTPDISDYQEAQP